MPALYTRMAAFRTGLMANLGWSQQPRPVTISAFAIWLLPSGRFRLRGIGVSARHRGQSHLFYTGSAVKPSRAGFV